MYNYHDSKDRIEDILASKTKIEVVKTVPSSDEEYTYSNGIKTWVGSIFVDMADSSDLCNKPDEKTARIFRAYSSEIIAILKDDSNYREIGIRGDCVYSINSTPYKEDIKQMFETAVTINTFMKMFNRVLEHYGYDEVKAGIGIGCSEDLIVKAGQNGSGINDKIWIGKAVVDASHLGDTANRHGISPIAMSPLVYDNIKDKLLEDNDKYQNWIHSHRSNPYSSWDTTIDFYHCDIIRTNMNEYANNLYK